MLGLIQYQACNKKHQCKKFYITNFKKKNCKNTKNFTCCLRSLKKYLLSLSNNNKKKIQLANEKLTV